MWSLPRMPLIERGPLNIEVGRLAVNKLSGLDFGDTSLRGAVAEWVKVNPPKTTVLPFLEEGYSFLSVQFLTTRKEVIQAYLLMEGVHALAAPTFGDAHSFYWSCGGRQHPRGHSKLCWTSRREGRLFGWCHSSPRTGNGTESP